MGHICLINPPGVKTMSGIQGNNPNPPIGLAYIAAAVGQAGHRVTVIDATGEAMDQITPMTARPDLWVQGLDPSEVGERIPADADVVGLGCLVSTLWPITRAIVERVHEARPELPIILGGEHVTALPEHALETSPATVCVVGEGDKTVVELLDRLLAGEDVEGVAGIVYRRGKEIVRTAPRARIRDVDALPLPAWDLFPVEEYIKRKQLNGIYQGRAMPILATRGCPFRCTFCSSPQMWTTKYTMRDVGQVCDEMELYMNRYGATDFHLQDLTAIVGKKWIIAFCDELIRRELKITWQIPSGTRCESIDDEVCAKLAATGCKNVPYAPESGSACIREAIRKEVDIDKMMASIRAALRHKLGLCCFFVVGFPQETGETIRDTLKMIRRLAWMGVQDVGIASFIPYPGSTLFKQLRAAGRIQLNDDFFASPIDYCSDEGMQTSYTDAFTSRQLYRWVTWLFLNFYVLSFIFHPWRTTKTMLRFFFTGREESRYAKWFRDRIMTRRKWRKVLASAGGQVIGAGGGCPHKIPTPPASAIPDAAADAGVLIS